ncbi:hypothetical protein [Roseivivax isoporae]|uniref:Uncharacterized protein n=1 Tax=Roseivivax isoporae LMG 25204 TaxID=1449351 RepID=X7F1J7_9RHOB|nr:hypothetical protein [Roseivivax isoporae]ETX26608.1 hypothetical protein RISW2_21820 [Roseivivax isoporae LMG 25204]
MAAKKDICIIKFVRTHVVQDDRVGTPEEERYTAGQRKSFPLRSAAHFVSRGAAVYVTRPDAD